MALSLATRGSTGSICVGQILWAVNVTAVYQTGVMARPEIPVLKRQRQEDEGFKVGLGYMGPPRSPLHICVLYVCVHIQVDTTERN